MIVNRNITLVCVENANYTIIVGIGFFVLLCKPLLLKFAVSQCSAQVNSSYYYFLTFPLFLFLLLEGSFFFISR